MRNLITSIACFIDDKILRHRFYSVCKFCCRDEMMKTQEEWLAMWGGDDDCCRDYCDRHDAYFCPTCNTWIEEDCNDPDCLYCKDRPAVPLLPD